MKSRTRIIIYTVWLLVAYVPGYAADATATNPNDLVFEGLVVLAILQAFIALGLMFSIGLLAIVGELKKQKVSTSLLPTGKTASVLILLLLTTGSLLAQETTAPTPVQSIAEKGFWAVVMLNTLLGGLNFLLVFATVGTLMTYYKKRFGFSLLEVPFVAKLFSFNAVVGLRPGVGSDKIDQPLDHNYDGIIELDNSAPPLFNYILYGTIGFAILYLGYYHVLGEGMFQEQEYHQEMMIAEAQKAERMKSGAFQVDENKLEALNDVTSLGLGQEVFGNYCAACHGTKGEGKVGPNLTDAYWIHGGGIENIFRTVKYGVPQNGMIAWEKQLSPAQMLQVASYILTLEGSNPPNPKEPQGSMWKAGPLNPAETVVDSSQKTLNAPKEMEKAQEIKK